VARYLGRYLRYNETGFWRPFPARLGTAGGEQDDGWLIVCVARVMSRKIWVRGFPSQLLSAQGPLLLYVLYILARPRATPLLLLPSKPHSRTEDQIIQVWPV
jgi:hypothetical protein